jgi:hypothetical protein
MRRIQYRTNKSKTTSRKHLYKYFSFKKARIRGSVGFRPHYIDWYITETLNPPNPEDCCNCSDCYPRKNILDVLEEFRSIW